MKFDGTTVCNMTKERFEVLVEMQFSIKKCINLFIAHLIKLFQDSLHQRHTGNDKIGNDKIDIATQMLTDALPKISMDINILEKIKCIASVKFALVLVAKLIYEMNSTSDLKILDEEKQILLEAASCICEESKSLWPR